MKVSRKSWHYRFIHWLFQNKIWWENPTMEFITYIIMFLWTIFMLPFKLLFYLLDRFADWVERKQFYIEFTDNGDK